MVTNTTYGAELEAAIEVVREASRLCEMVRLEMIDSLSTTKADTSPVTVADYGAQALICRGLSSHFPHDPIVAEESSADLVIPEGAELLAQVIRFVDPFHAAQENDVCTWIDFGGGAAGDRFWTLDPLDGTRGFLRNDQYAIALALIVNSDVVVGTLACPSLPHDLDDPNGAQGVLYWAARGAGIGAASLDSFDPLPEVDDAIVRQRLVQSLEASTSHHKLQETIASRLELTDSPLKMDSQAKYVAVARGDACLYLRLPSPATPDYRENIWDHAAGVLLVEESGGVVTDSSGNRLDFTRGHKLEANVGVVASRDIDHASVLELITSAQSL